LVILQRYYKMLGPTIKIEIDVREVGWESMDWFYLAGHRDNWRAIMSGK
jgi:hypothetical protein